MIKITGILLAFTASALLGFIKSDSIKKRRDLLIEFKNLINHLSTQIGYFKEPLPVIFKKLAEDWDDEGYLLLNNCLMYYEIGEKNISEIWSQAVENTFEKSRLTEEDMRVMKKCGSFIGQSDYENQQKHFRLFFDELDRQIEEAEEDLKNKGSMYRKMGMSLGAIIAIVLI